MALVLIAALVAIVPQLVRGNSCGHDFDVHLVSMLDCANAWRHGLLYPHWTPSANYGAGEPRFIFYPPITWMSGAALGLIFPWSFVPIALTFLILAGTGLATRWLALEACSDAVATLAGCASIFSGFALFTAYERSAFPEFMGGVCLPLLLKFALRDRNPSGNLLRRAFDGSAVPLTFALAASWLSNAPLGVIASYLLAAVALLAAVLHRSWAPIVRAAVASVLGLGIIAAYLLPAALERAWVDIREAYNDPGYNFENNWAFARHADPSLALHDFVLRQASIIAISMIGVALVCIAICWRRGALSPLRSNGSRCWWIVLAVIPVVVLIILFPVSRPIWYLLPEWRFLQYPWRWLEAVEAPMAIFFAAAVWPTRRKAQYAVATGCAIAFCAALLYTNRAFFQVCDVEDTVASTLIDYRTAAGFEGMYEYEPPDSDRELIPMNLPAACLVSSPTTVLGKEDDDGDLVWSADQHSCLATFAASADPISDPEHLRLSAAIPQSGYLVLRLLRYPAWRVEVNGQIPSNASALIHREDGLIAFPVQAGALHVSVDWTTTPDVVAGRWLSILCALLLIALLLAERRIARSSASPARGRS
ncbi:MAG TPA: hypothetical protein VIM62_09710 [Acidobacteriaceae bacterium]